ncbi:endonuclease/exonuclease/phosphatase family protein [Natronoflexus pectinivorans]|uniref:Endonuclease/exonuclease/phosphatase domain-containing protein n=1 Tax=Natronoflexus pectinivorans TaxID=682526 RepID=A0A4R2G6W4_9BACT|nr:endonuclease/exonuclease/phosphatase family protein [Natronoflexus pectinivorans]TCO03009.1 hypothetical protein EV194_1225 [Natronoflexus pectinivorans]
MILPKNRCFFVVVALMLLFGATQFSYAQQTRAGVIAFYNLENLYDTINDPNIRDDDFTPEGVKRWNSPKYWEKIDRLAEVISKLGSHENIPGPAIIGLCELENRAVLEDLVQNERIRHLNYQIVHHYGPDRRGMDVALLYQPRYFRVTSSRSVPLEYYREDGSRLYTRDQLLVSGVFDGEPMHFIVNHYPSRWGGEERSRPLRVAAAQLSRALVDEILDDDPDAKVIVMGDFNDDPINESIKVHLNAHGNQRRLEEGQLYNPFEPLHRRGVGTLAYRGQWNLFDQILLTQSFLNRDQEGYRYHSVRVFNESFLTRDEGRFRGYPFRSYVGNQYMGGYSDHFPVYIVLVRTLH